MRKEAGHDEFLRQLGSLIKSRRTELGLTQEQLAERIGSESQNDQRSYVSKLESGQRNPSASQLKRIAQALNMSPCDLMMEASTHTDHHEQQCDEFKRCHGEDAYQLVKEFLKLDPGKRDDVMDYISMKLEQQKKKELSEEKEIS